MLRAPLLAVPLHRLACRHTSHPPPPVLLRHPHTAAPLAALCTARVAFPPPSVIADQTSPHSIFLSSTLISRSACPHIYCRHIQLYAASAALPWLAAALGHLFTQRTTKLSYKNEALLTVFSLRSLSPSHQCCPSLAYCWRRPHCSNADVPSPRLTCHLPPDRPRNLSLFQVTL